MNDAQQKIESYIAKQDDWKKEKLKDFRSLVHEINPDITEEWKWNVPIFSLNGKMKLSMAAFKNHVKYNFFVEGIAYKDEHKLFNNGFDSTHFRSIDIKENEKIDAKKLRELVAQFL
jgi:hypothetical protein